MSWRLARSLEQMQDELDSRFPQRLTPDWTIGDVAHRNRPSDHNPNSAGVVCAIDVRSVSVARFLWNHLRNTRDHRIKYMIFSGRIMSSTVSPWVSRRYTGANPHNDHIHISVGNGPDGQSTGPYDDISPWDIADVDSGGNVLPRKGDTGEIVELYQRILVDNGFDTVPPNGQASWRYDGIYGDGTQAAVAASRVAYGSDSINPDVERITPWNAMQLLKHLNP